MDYDPDEVPQVDDQIVPEFVATLVVLDDDDSEDDLDTLIFSSGNNSDDDDSDDGGDHGNGAAEARIAQLRQEIAALRNENDQLRRQ